MDTSPGLSLTVDCHDPSRLVEFWGPLLGYVVPPPPETHETWRDYYLSIGVPAGELGDGDAADRLVPAEGVAGWKIWFQQVPEDKVAKNRLHLDVWVTAGVDGDADRETAVRGAVDDAVARGGSVLRWNHVEPSGRLAATMADPEGNEFCIT